MGKHHGFLGWIQDHVPEVALGAVSIVAPEFGIPALGAYELAKVMSKKSTKTTQVDPTKHPHLSSDHGTHKTDPATIPWKKVAPYTGAYKYNAPMVNDALFNPTHVPDIDDNGVFAHVDLKAYQNVKNAWGPSTGNQKAAKGAIQMDRYLWKSSEAMKSVTSYLKSKKQTVPTDMYGFRFLYNPQTVGMSWGQSSFTNNQALLQGLDTIVPSAPGTMNSSITFWVPLNRIQDMSALNPDGTYSGPVDPNKLEEMSLQKIKKEVLPIKLPYAYDVPISERKLIYEKGTMYDIEWLMKAINGWAFLDHTSDVSGLQTNDMGFILQFPVELHLGNTMRYRVQITDIQVNHIIFNARMIPIWSTVNFTCRRFPEVNYSDISKNVGK